MDVVSDLIEMLIHRDNAFFPIDYMCAFFDKRISAGGNAFLLSKSFFVFWSMCCSAEREESCPLQGWQCCARVPAGICFLVDKGELISSILCFSLDIHFQFKFQFTLTLMLGTFSVISFSFSHVNKLFKN